MFLIVKNLLKKGYFLLINNQNNFVVYRDQFLYLKSWLRNTHYGEKVNPSESNGSQNNFFFYPYLIFLLILRFEIVTDLNRDPKFYDPIGKPKKYCMMVYRGEMVRGTAEFRFFTMIFEDRKIGACCKLCQISAPRKHRTFIFVSRKSEKSRLFIVKTIDMLNTCAI